ncbi:MAG: S1/P1 nuclease [Bacteroidales bacterium]|nr:S1/P1 nuclease [Bacteroidales bacterium]
MKKSLSLIIVIFMIVSTQRAMAWFDQGHMVIASIAWAELSHEEQLKANYLIKILEDADPDYSDFIRAATWMDGMQQYGMNYFFECHFINQYYAVYSPDIMPEYDKYNVVWMINQSVKTLKDPRASEYAMAMALRFLIHTVGDIHQPMHNTSRVAEDTPNGDRGGNAYPIDSIRFGFYNGKPSYITNLHKLWDCGVIFFQAVNANDTTFSMHKVNHDKEKIMKYIRSLNEKEYALIKCKICNVTNPAEWARESYKIGVNNSYQGIQENSLPSDEYVKKAQEICKDQAYIAGKRLAFLLKEVLKNMDVPD